ncbi:MAG: protein kinase domain-containing protein [Chthonomonadales bacterium]
MISRPINMRYEVLERVGEGAFFQVYKARDRTTGRVVAVKTLQPAFIADQAFRSALVEAAKSVRILDHAQIARVLEVGEERGAPYVVVEFVRGINLKQRIARIAPFTLSVAVDFAIAIGEALQYAHGLGMVHGDLRPENVIVSPEGAVKVTDFGMAAAMAASPAAFAVNLPRAAPYRPPEAVDGTPPSLSGDLYALGVILFEMITGALPYAGDTPQAIAASAARDVVPSPRALNPGVPRSVEGIAMKALQKRPEDRYIHAADFLSDLKSVRDALRFGRSLSWSPSGVSAPQSGPAPQAPQAESAKLQPTQAPRRSATGVSAMAGSSARDEGVSPLLKIALATVVVIIITAVVAGVAAWMAIMTKPPEQRVPNLVGKRIEEVRAIAEKANVRLLEHEEYNDQYDPGVVFKADWAPGRPIAPGRTIPVWVSKGSRMVWVPSVLGKTPQDAEDTLKAQGLTLGEVDRQYSDTFPFGEVMAQNPRAGKRVPRDQPVNLTISDGPKPQAETPPSDTGSPNEAAPSTPPSEAAPGGEGIGAGNQVSIQRIRVTVPRDGHGSRRVRVEYDDANGTHTPIDELHNEGDVVSKRVEVAGPTMTVRVYYNDDVNPAVEQTVPVSPGAQR